jgi:hypothetical protein
MQYLANNIPSKQLLTIHDEQTDECPLEYQDVVQDIMSRMYGEASKILKYMGFLLLIDFLIN